MKATFLLVAAVWATGDHPAPAPAPTVVAPSSCSSCSGCSGYVGDYGYYGDCCGRPSLLDRLRCRLGGLFNRGGCCGGCETSSCDTCTTTSSCCTSGSCASGSCTTGCDTGYTYDCGSCCQSSGWTFGCRLRALFQRNSCCEPSCGGYGYDHGYGCSSSNSGIITQGPVPHGNVISTTPAAAPKVTIPPAKNGEEGPAKKMPTGENIEGSLPIDTDTNLIAPPVPGPIDTAPASAPLPNNEPDLGIAPPASVPDLNTKTPF